MQQNNMNANVGVSNPNSGAVYTSEFNSQQGPGTQAGAVYTSGMNTAGMSSNTGTYNNYNQHVGSTDPNSGAVYTSGINQQGPGNQAGAVYTSGANTQGMQSGFMNQGNFNGQTGMGYSNAGAVYTSGSHQQQGPGTQAGAVYTSGINTSGSQSNFNNQRNAYGQVGMSDPNSGAVYTSGTNQQQGLGAQAGAVYTSGASNYNYGMSFNQSSNVQQIKQQLQNMQSQLRQTQSYGYEGEIYVDVANRLQDAYEILNQNRL